MKRVVYFLLAILMVRCSMTPPLNSQLSDLPQRFLYSDTIINDTISQSWWKSFDNATLDLLIDKALANNKDLLQTLLNVEVARSTAANTRADLLPSLSLEAKASVSYDEYTKSVQTYQVRPVVSWDIDLFGEIRNMSQSAKASYLSTFWAARAVQLTLAAEVATTYFSLIEYRSSREVARLTYDSRVKSLSMIDTMLAYGTTTLLSYNQAKSLTISAKQSLSQYEMYVEQTEASLALLVGEYPHELDIADSYINLDIDITVAMPSLLLERRPDVIESYYNLVSTNYDIGVARAQRLPSLSLTGEGGLFDEVANSGDIKPIAWAAVAALTQPIFAFGKNKRNVAIAKQKNQIAYLAYEQSMLTAVSDVEKALASIVSYRAQLEDARIVVESNRQVQDLTQQLYYTGLGDYLNVLDAERSYFDSQIQYQELSQQLGSSYVALYKALGGGL